ncbi:hypothetical protein MMC10_006226 [Thelotrema lepadinum]|nr:hypothetical protein [Thelotrema lepadinum]
MDISSHPTFKSAPLGPSSGPTTTITTSSTFPPPKVLPHPSQPSLSPSNPTTITKPPLDPRVTLSPLSPSTLPPFKRLTSTLLPIRYPDAFYTSLLGPEEKTLSFAYVALWTAGTSTPTTIPTNSSPLPLADPKQRGQVVGGISVRLEPLPPSDDSHNPSHSHSQSQKQSGSSGKTLGEHALYISTLSVLSPYRHYGIGAHLIQTAVAHALELVERLNSPPPPSPPTSTPDTPRQDQPPPGGAGITLKYVYAHVWETNAEAAEWYARRGFEVGDVVEGYYRRLKPGGARVVRRGVVGAAMGGSGGNVLGGREAEGKTV